jgi:sugar lactone lactonase YvrE
MWFSPDGSKMYVLNGASVRVYYYTLSTAFKPSTSTLITNVDLSANDTNQTGVVLNPTGTKLFTTGLTDTEINEYALSTAFDLSSISHTRAFSISAQVGSPQDLAFNADGTKMFVLDSVGDDVNEYTLSTGFNISTASFVDAFSISGQENAPTGLSFSADGTQMFIVGTTNDTVFKYTLSSGFDVSSASYSGTSFSIAAKETSPQLVAFNADGSKMYVGGSSSDSITEYTSQLTIYPNQMDKTQLDAVTDPNHIALSNDFDLSIILNMTSGTTVPSSNGVAINYDANILNKGAVLGTDYDFDAPAQNKVRITALAGNNLKVRVV